MNRLVAEDFEPEVLQALSQHLVERRHWEQTPFLFTDPPLSLTELTDDAPERVVETLQDVEPERACVVEIEAPVIAARAWEHAALLVATFASAGGEVWTRTLDVRSRDAGETWIVEPFDERAPIPDTELVRMLRGGLVLVRDGADSGAYDSLLGS